MKGFRSEYFVRSLIALIILMAGVAMSPFVDLPQLRLGWQQFAGVYEGQLVVNYDDGKPGSYFHFTGSNLPANQEAVIFVNGDEVGRQMTNNQGQLAFNLGTNQAPVGPYTVTVVVNNNASGSDSFTLAANAPLRQLEGPGPLYTVVDLIYLPLIFK